MQKYVGGIYTDNEKTLQERSKLSYEFPSYCLQKPCLIFIIRYFLPKRNKHRCIGIPQG
jgi:hypothetical protein